MTSCDPNIKPETHTYRKHPAAKDVLGAMAKLRSPARCFLWQLTQKKSDYDKLATVSLSTGAQTNNMWTFNGELAGVHLLWAFFCVIWLKSFYFINSVSSYDIFLSLTKAYILTIHLSALPFLLCHMLTNMTTCHRLYRKYPISVLITWLSGWTLTKLNQHEHLQSAQNFSLIIAVHSLGRAL